MATIAFLCGVAVTGAVLYLRAEARANGSAMVPTPYIIASQCMVCRGIKCVDNRWLPEAIVTLPVDCNISHGYCPACAFVVYARLSP